jgi:hypothetical protein
MVCPKFNSHVYKLKRWAIFLYIATGCPKRCFYWGVPSVPKKNGDGPMNMAPSKKKNKF